MRFSVIMLDALGRRLHVQGRRRPGVRQTLTIRGEPAGVEILRIMDEAGEDVDLNDAERAELERHLRGR